MATAVQIELRVDEKGAVQGVRAFDSAIKNTQSSVRQLDKDLSQVNKKSEMEKLASEFTGGESSLRTMNAEVRSLQGDLYGDSRAASEFLAIFPKIGEAMELAFPAFGAIAFVSVLAEAIDKGHELYEKWFDVDEAVKKYQEDAAKAAEQKLFDEGAFETQFAMFDDLNRQIDQLREKKKNSYNIITSKLLGEDVFPYFSQDDAKRLSDLMNKADAESLKNLKNEFDAQEARRQDNEKKELAAAPEYRRPGIERRYADLKADDLQLYISRRDNKIADVLNRGKAAKDQMLPPTDDGWRQAQLIKEHAQADFDAKGIERVRAYQDTLRHMREEALESELHGIALLEAQRNAALDDLTAKGISTSETISAVNRKYNAEESKFLQNELNATQMIQARAAAAGMTGIQKIQAEGDIQVGEIRGSNLSDRAKDARSTAAEQQTNAQIIQAQRQFTEQIESLVDQSADHQIQGFARIRTAEAKQLDDLKKKFDETYGHMDMSKDGATGVYAKGKSDYERGVAAIHRGTADQVAELSRRNAAETEDIEAQARARYFSAEKNKTAAIEAEYEERKNKLFEQWQQQEIGWKDYNRRLVAAGQERDAELVQAATAAHDKMAREFESVFRSLDHPLRMLQDMAAKAASEAAATMVQRIEAHGKGPGAAPAEIGGIFGGLFGHHTAHASRDRNAEMPGREISASSSTLAISTALIQVGTAQIAFGGGAAGAGSNFPSSSFSGGSSFLSSSFSGGAGSAGAPESPAHTGGGVMPTHGGGVASVLGNLQQGVGLSESAMSIFKRSASSTNGLQTTDKDIPNGTLNADGSYTNSSTGGMLQGGGFMSNAMGAGGGALGLFGAYESNGGAGGALSGAMSGMQLGMALGGPVGAAVGAAAGAIFGAIGFGGREKAHVYDLKNVRPRIQSDQLAYNAGSMDYMSAYSDMQALDMEAKKTTNSMGPAAKSYYKDTIEGEIHKAIQRFDNEEKAGRSQYTASAAQYAIGLDRAPHTGLAVIHKDERIVPSDENRQITRALNLHTSYQAAMQRGSIPSMMRTAGDLHVHLNSIDSKTGTEFLMSQMHTVRRAYNASLGENSGGADA